MSRTEFGYVSHLFIHLINTYRMLSTGANNVLYSGVIKENKGINLSNKILS